MAYVERKRVQNQAYDKAHGMQQKRMMQLGIGIDSVKIQENTTRYPTRQALTTGYSLYAKNYGPLPVTSTQFAEFQKGRKSGDGFFALEKVEVKKPDTSNVHVPGAARVPTRIEHQVLAGEKIRDENGVKKRSFLTNSDFGVRFVRRFDSMGYSQLYPGLGVLNKSTIGPSLDETMLEQYARDRNASKPEEKSLIAPVDFGKQSMSQRKVPLDRHLPRYGGFVRGEEFVHGTCKR
jgi:hypothetical protein